MLDISLVLYNSSSHLPALVESLVRQSVPLEDIALLVTDNASTDGCTHLLEELLSPHRERFRAVTIIRSAENLGFGCGHNTAIAHGDAPFVFILNPDAELHPECLATLLSAATDDSAAAAWEARQVPYEHPKVYDPVTGVTPWVSGAGVLLRRSAFEAINGFDDKIFLYGEDVDLSWRLQDRGHVLRYCPKAILIHRTYSRANEVKLLQFIGSIRANLYLRTRFGTWRDIAAGIVRHLSLLRPSRRQIPRQGRVVLKGFYLWIKNFHHWRSGAARTVPHNFHGWEYAVHRAGAFHDVSAGIEMGKHPKVSILIRTLGKQNLLAMALETVARQTYPNIETVIVQDGPATLEVFLDSWKQKLAIVYKPLGENKGRCIAGNEAMAAAHGDYCCFLDEDDLLYADHVEQLVAAVTTHKARVAYSFAFELPSSYAEGGDGIIAEGELFSRFPWNFSFPRLLNSNYIPIQSVLFARSLFTECGGFDPAIPYNEDWNLWVRYAIAARPFIVVPKTTSVYRVPMDHAHNAERHAVMLEHRERVRALHAQLAITLTDEEKRELEQPSVQQAGLRDSLIARYPRYRRIILLAAGIRRKCAW